MLTQNKDLQLLGFSTLETNEGFQLLDPFCTGNALPKQGSLIPQTQTLPGSPREFHAVNSKQFFSYP